MLSPRREIQQDGSIYTSGCCDCGCLKSPQILPGRRQALRSRRRLSCYIFMTDCGSTQSSWTHFSAKHYRGAATELIANDTPILISTNPRNSATTMLPRRIVAARPLARAIVPAVARPRPQFIQIRTALTDAEKSAVELADPNQNGGYINPPAEKRGNRDPYGDYWDKQERRNYGEPCHEDNDILGVLALHDYNHFSPQWGFVLMGTFIATVFGLCAAVGTVYPDKLSAPKTYPDGLEAELGGKGALLARKPGEGW